MDLPKGTTFKYKKSSSKLTKLDNIEVIYNTYQIELIK